MTDINRVVLVGRLVRDLGNDQRDFAYTPSGQARANISIAVNRSRKQGDQWVEEANFFDVTIWGKTAENLKPYLTKGKQIAVEGYLKQDRWEKDGQKFSKVGIVADSVMLLGGRSDNGGSQSSGGYTPKFQQNNGFSQQQSYQPPADVPSFGGDGGGYSEDIPF
ncbi:MAG: single-stranded DNA-binding protein [Spirochaetia bacterium]|uniref:single-stranded DNA-binding protein n=1 Tax=Treponema berlinense TaxID=225004 RepID=UPI0015B93E75|nr:single-stranded DNA-binding protein [Treponema berlinense]MDD5790044.1 single-stranded DNA-binding protein [Spirochaetia bacterium]